MFLFDNREKTYTIKAPNGLDVVFDEKTNLIIPNDKYPNEKHPNLTKAPEIKAKMIIDARAAMNASPYINYKPLIFKKDSDMNGFRGHRNANLYMLNWKKLYIKGSMKGIQVAPWTNSEKAYYESLDGRGRYNYLVTRSGIESSIIIHKDIALKEIERPKEKIYIQTYNEASKEYDEILKMIKSENFYFKSDEEIWEIYKNRYIKFESVVKKLNFVYDKSRDYKSGLLLAEIYMNSKYYVGMALSPEIYKHEDSERDKWGMLCPALRKIGADIQERSKKAVRILLDLIEKYNLPDAYYGMYRYCIAQAEFNQPDVLMYNAANIIKTKEYWFDLALKYGSYDAFKSQSSDLNRELLNAEYCLSAGILGNNAAFNWAGIGLNRWGFATRDEQAGLLAMQLGFENELRIGKGMYKILKKIPKDKYGLRPFLTEYIDIPFYEELNRTNYEGDPSYLRWESLAEMVESGKLLEPTNNKATKETRDEYRKVAMNWYKNPYDAIGFKEEWEDYVIERHANRVILRSKILALTPPQGYPNAPFYYFPEEIEEKFEKGELDFNLDPRIPAMYRVSFPVNLRQKILDYAKKHNIKDNNVNYGA